MELSLENLEKAVSQFYQNLTQSQSQLNLWLTAAQSSSQAWIFAWQLLDQTKAVEVQHFGASSLQMKISRFWQEIPSQEHGQLRQRLINVVLSYANGPKIVLNKLCLALSSMILHSIPDHWANPLGDFISMLQQASGGNQLLPQYITLLLQILTVLPEEFQTMRLAHERKIAIKGELLKAVKDVLPILREVICRGVTREGSPITAEDEAASLAGIKCLSSWIQHGVGVGLEESIHLVDPLLSVARNPDLAESALDALTHLANHPEANRYPNLLMGMLGQLLSLKDHLQSLRHESQLEAAAQIYALFAAFGESHSRLLLDSVLEEGPKKEHVLQLIQILLESTGTPGRYPLDENCSHLAFSFWYILQDDICSASCEKHEAFRTLFGPAYLTLVDLLMTKSMVSPDQADWAPDDKETFRCYRQDIADTLAYCYKFLRTSMMERLASHLAATVSQCNVNPNDWPPLEACLHALKAVAEFVEGEADQQVPQILNLFGSIPYGSGHRYVVNTALETLGAYAEWLSAHPTYLGHVLPILLFGLTQLEATPAATLALKDITRDCQMGIRPYAEALLQGAEQALRLDDLKDSEKVRLMYILGKVLSILPLEAIIASLNRIVGPCVEELRALCTSVQEPDAQTKALLITRLRMLGTLCTALDMRVCSGEDSEAEETGVSAGRPAITVHQQPVLLIAQQLLPYLKGVVDRWGTDEQITESICSVVKHTVTTLMDESLAFLPELASVIVQCHRLSPQTATLDVAKLVIQMFSSQSSGATTQQLIRAFLSEIIGTSLIVCGVDLATATPDSVPQVDVARLAENHDVLASFLNLLSQVIRKNPQVLLSGAAYPLPSLFYCGIIGLTRPESSTMKASTQYLVHFITQSRENPDLVAVVQNQGLLLVSQLLSCIGGESPRALVEHTADVILALNKKYFDSLCRWTSTALARERFPSALVSPQQKENFCRSILKERSNKRRLQDIVREFSLQCRGLDGTEYSEQTCRILP